MSDGDDAFLSLIEGGKLRKDGIIGVGHDLQLW